MNCLAEDASAERPSDGILYCPGDIRQLVALSEVIHCLESIGLFQGFESQKSFVSGEARENPQALENRGIVVA